MRVMARYSSFALVSRPVDNKEEKRDHGNDLRSDAQLFLASNTAYSRNHLSMKMH